MKIHRLHCLLLSALILLCSCNESKSESSEQSVSTNTSSISEESTQETEPVRYTYRSEADIYDISDIYEEPFYSFHYIGGNMIVGAGQRGDALEDPIMSLYDLSTGEIIQNYLPHDDTERICRAFFGVRENGEFGLASRFGECVWFDKEGNYLGLDLWFDGDDISPEYHNLIDGFEGNVRGYSDNGEDLLIYHDYERAVLKDEYCYMMYNRTTGETTEFMVGGKNAAGDEYVSYKIRGFVGKNRILYQKYTKTKNDAAGDTRKYTLHLLDLSTEEEIVAELEDDIGELWYIRETKNGCAFVMRDRRWLKTMELSNDGTLTQVGNSFTAVAQWHELALTFDATTRTIAVMTQDSAHGGNLTVKLLDADTLIPYASIEIPLEENFFGGNLFICPDGTVQIFAQYRERANMILWRPEI